MVAISLVVGTRNRSAQLTRCLSAIAEMRPSCRWELVVVDNGSSDSTLELLNSFARSVSFPVTILEERIPGLGRAHNRGWRTATGEIIAFTDDDCYVARDFLDHALAAFADRKIGYCGGRVKLYDLQDHPITINESSEPQIFPPHAYIPAGVIQGANMIFRRSALDEIGGFDDNLGPGTPFNCEDIDAFARAAFAGWWGAYSPGPTVFHAHGRKAADVPALRRSYAIGRGAYAAKFMRRRDIQRGFIFIRWGLHLAKGFVTRGSRRESALEIEGAIRYWCRNLLH